ncbi:RNI-like protein [Westerdykella ornata]|uniref:RNI-like protein n=1 Tax=Westerdykella ornata TaxID=318751 RepID=A0A6A6JFN2_WESOR|nr:RNI-like protein [Westerdykella ornata]KAF2275430.1 RNI-like protein [Westerdykella ornata]
MSRARRVQRDASRTRSDTSASTSPDRGVDLDDDKDSFMSQDNDSQSSLSPSLTPDSEQETLRRAFEERSRVSPISRLPAELMIAIFSKLSSPIDLRNCMLVSKDWAHNSVALLWHRPHTGNWECVRNVISTVSNPNSYFDYSSLVKRLNLSNLGSQVNDGTLQPLSGCKRVERLTLTGCTRLTDLSLTAMLQGNRRLLALDVSNVGSITDRTMYALAENAVRLQGLNITKCDKISDGALEAVARNCKQIKRLKLNGCEQLTDRAIIAFARNCRYLLEVDLFACSNLEDESVTSLITEGPHLRELRLARCTRITDQAFLRLPPDTTYESLRILDLTDCGELQDAGVQKIVTAAPRLRNLVLAKCRRITDRAVLAITRLGKNLHFLHLGHCVNITDFGLNMLIKACNRIRYIDLACCTELTDNSVTQLATLPKLKRIGLVKCSNITDRTIQALARPKQLGPGGPVTATVLERVHLSYCTNLTLGGIYTLLRHCPKLTHLSLTGVHAFLRDDLLEFIRPAPEEFNEHQREVFCVFSGAGVVRLRQYLLNNPPGMVPRLGFGTGDNPNDAATTMYDDGEEPEMIDVTVQANTMAIDEAWEDVGGDNHEGEVD